MGENYKSAGHGFLQSTQDRLFERKIFSQSDLIVALLDIANGTGCKTLVCGQMIQLTQTINLSAQYHDGLHIKGVGTQAGFQVASGYTLDKMFAADATNSIDWGLAFENVLFDSVNSTTFIDFNSTVTFGASSTKEFRLEKVRFAGNGVVDISGNGQVVLDSVFCPSGTITIHDVYSFRIINCNVRSVTITAPTFGGVIANCIITNLLRYKNCFSISCTGCTIGFFADTTSSATGGCVFSGCSFANQITTTVGVGEYTFVGNTIAAGTVITVDSATKVADMGPYRSTQTLSGANPVMTVGSLDMIQFTIAAGSTGSITLTDGMSQILTLRCINNLGAAVFTDTSVLRLAGNWVPTSSGMLTLRFDGGVWLELSRSAN